MAYVYFKKATETWLEKNKKTQNWLALELAVNDGTISRYFGESRNIPFDKQLKIAHACGYDYLAFLQYGKNILEGFTVRSNNIQKLDDSTIAHQGIIPSFKDEKTGKEINENLLKIEAADSKKFYKLAGRIEAIAEEFIDTDKEDRHEPGESPSGTDS